MKHPDISPPSRQPRVVILGGGFAGVWAAIAASERGAEAVHITLVTPDDRFVPRPRLYQAAPQTTTVALGEVLDPRGVEHLRGRATAIDTTDCCVAVTDADGTETCVAYDRLVLATGSQLRRPPIDTTHIDDIDTIGAAEALDRRLTGLGAGATIVVVGSGFTGIELACELPARVPGARVVLIERAREIAPELGPNPRPAIQGALDELGVECRTDTTIEGFDGATVRLDDGSSLPADAVVWTAGIGASPLAGLVSADLDALGRLNVDQCLRVDGVPGVFAAGDVAAPRDEAGHTVAQSAQHAMPQGTCAGHNAVADLLGDELTELSTIPYGVCLDLGSAGAVFTEGWDREVRLVGDEAKAIKRDINTTWLYPPRA